MKSKVPRKIVFSKNQNDDTPTKIYRDFNGGIGLRTWCQMIHRSGSITFSSPPGRLRLIRTKAK